MKLIVGLGNPGEEYKNTRHNTGWIILDHLLGNIDWKSISGTKALFYKDTVGGKPVIFLKPTTFMNNSGVAVSYVQNEKNKIKTQDIIVIYDDIDLPIGKMKISFNRSSGGHNGLESIIKKLKTKEFVRIRIGISPLTPSDKIRKPKGEKAILKFLLGKFKDNELKELKKITKKVEKIIETWALEGKDKAMSLYN